MQLTHLARGNLFQQIKPKTSLAFLRFQASAPQILVSSYAVSEKSLSPASNLETRIWFKKKVVDKVCSSQLSAVSLSAPIEQAHQSKTRKIR